MGSIYQLPNKYVTNVGEYGIKKEVINLKKCQGTLKHNKETRTEQRTFMNEIPAKRQNSARDVESAAGVQL